LFVLCSLIATYQYQQYPESPLLHSVKASRIISDSRPSKYRPARAPKQTHAVIGGAQHRRARGQQPISFAPTAAPEAQQCSRP
jgi:hypothetical protein